RRAAWCGWRRWRSQTGWWWACAACSTPTSWHMFRHSTADLVECGFRQGEKEASMSQLGKQIRMKRVLDQDTGTSLICALDHGMTSPIFLEPLADIAARAREAVAGGANVLMLSRGMSRLALEALAK